MFRCSRCDVPVGPGVPAVRVVFEFRPRVYPHRERANRLFRPEPPRERWIDDPGGAGREVVREGLLCQACARRLARIAGGTD